MPIMLEMTNVLDASRELWNLFAIHFCVPEHSAMTHPLKTDWHQPNVPKILYSLMSRPEREFTTGLLTPDAGVYMLSLYGEGMKKESVKTTSMENVSARVLDTNKELYLRCKYKAKNSYDV